MSERFSQKLSDKELKDPEYMRAYIDEMYLTYVEVADCLKNLVKVYNRTPVTVPTEFDAEMEKLKKSLGLKDE